MKTRKIIINPINTYLCSLPYHLEMTTSTEEHQCDCHDEQHKPEDRQKHKHVGDECIHEDGTRHKIHQRQ
jgi:hypothetical protein